MEDDGMYTITVIGPDGSEERMEFDNARDYDYVLNDYREYDSCSCCDYGTYAIVEWMKEEE